MTSSSTPSPTKKRRLKDQQRPSRRTNVTRACDECKFKKIRCNGLRPCARCTSKALHCRYEAPYNRGNPERSKQILNSSSPSTEFSLTDNHRSSSTTLELKAATGDINNKIIATSRYNSSSSSSSDIVDGIGGGGSSGEIDSDFDRREDGDGDDIVSEIDGSSSIAFLDRAMKQLKRHNPVTSFSFGNSRIPDFDAASFILPSHNEAHQLAAYYFDFIASTNRMLHRPTIESQIKSLYFDRRLIMSGGSGDLDRGVCATLFAIFAQSTLHLEPPSSNAGVSYYLAAERQLDACRGMATLPCVQAYILMVIFLAMSSRMDQSWSLLGKTVRLAQTINLHRKGRKGNGVEGALQHELRKRTFWVLYMTDRMVSMIVGRPCTLHDQDIDQELPSLLEDEDLSIGFTLSSNIASTNSSISTASSTTTGAKNVITRSSYPLIGSEIEHSKLTLVVSDILSDFYSARRSLTVQKASEYLRRLEEWKTHLPPYLDEERKDSEPRVPILRHARITLLCAYYHAQILIYRPFLMGSVEQFGEVWVEKATNECLSFSKKVFELTSDLVQRGLLAGWFTIYNSINAVLVVYVHTIQTIFSPLFSVDLFLAAENCEELLSENTTDNQLAERFLIVLKELRSEIRKQLPFREAVAANGAAEIDFPGADISSPLLVITNTRNGGQLSDTTPWYEFDNNALIETLTTQIFNFYGTPPY